MADHSHVPPGAPTHTPPADEMPDVQEMSRRARWLRSLSDGQRELLPDMSLGDVERLYARWVDEVDAAAHP